MNDPLSLRIVLLGMVISALAVSIGGAASERATKWSAVVEIVPGGERHVVFTYCALGKGGTGSAHFSLVERKDEGDSPLEQVADYPCDSVWSAEIVRGLIERNRLVSMSRAIRTHPLRVRLDLVSYLSVTLQVGSTKIEVSDADLSARRLHSELKRFSVFRRQLARILQSDTTLMRSKSKAIIPLLSEVLDDRTP